VLGATKGALRGRHPQSSPKKLTITASSAQDGEAADCKQQ
jgi:hypothetical protein